MENYKIKSSSRHRENGKLRKRLEQLEDMVKSNPAHVRPRYALMAAVNYKGNSAIFNNSKILPETKMSDLFFYTDTGETWFEKWVEGLRLCET